MIKYFLVVVLCVPFVFAGDVMVWVLDSGPNSWYGCNESLPGFYESDCAKNHVVEFNESANTNYTAVRAAISHGIDWSMSYSRNEQSYDSERLAYSKIMEEYSKYRIEHSAEILIADIGYCLDKGGQFETWVDGYRCYILNSDYEEYIRPIIDIDSFGYSFGEVQND